MGWIMSSNIYKWIAIFFIIIVLILTAMTIREIGLVDSSATCMDDRDFRIGKYHFLLSVVNEKCET
jgi:hypothetical protein